LPQKYKRLEKLKSNVQAQESKLLEALGQMQRTHKENGNVAQGATVQRWEGVDKVVAVMEDLLSSYRKYTEELERRMEGKA